MREREVDPKLLNAVRRILADPRPIWMQVRMREVERGNTIVPPGDEPWFPLEDWMADGCISRTRDGEVRIVLIQARREGTGAFRRLVDGIVAAGLRPVVVGALPEMTAILTRWGWRCTEAGDTFETREDQWRPRQ